MAPNPSTNVQLDVAVDREREPLLSDFVTVAVPPDSDRLITKELSKTHSTCKPKVRSRKLTYRSMTQLMVFALAELIGGLTFSLLAPFYTKEATGKGLTVSETGLVYGSVFVTTILFSPVFGKYIHTIGSRNLFLYGTFLAGSSNVLFGFLEYVEETKTFFVLSMAIRVVSAVGEAAFFCAIYPLATQAAPVRYRSTVLSVMETMFGLGLMVGPFMGSVLYEVDGFYLPFVVCGGVLTLCPVLALFCIGGSGSLEPLEHQESTPFMKLLRMPCVYLSCLILCIAQSSVAWYLPILEPFLAENFSLTTFATGAMFTVEGATYAAFSPLWGWLLDKWISPWLALTVGTSCVIVGYVLLGPSPLLPFIPSNIYMVGFSLSLMGFGVAATFITTLTFMLTESVAHGAADNEQTRGMITSLWFISENLGAYAGASLGGFAYDNMGFEHGTTVVIGFQLIALIAIPVMWKLNARSKLSPGPSLRQRLYGTERTRLISETSASRAAPMYSTV